MKKLGLLALATLLFTSCSQNLFNFTIISTKNIELSKLSSLQKASEQTKGEDKASIIIIVPIKRIKVDQAISNTIDAIPGCVALLDGVVHIKSWYIPYIYGEQKFVVQATPLIDPSIEKVIAPLPKYGKIFLNRKGEIKSIKSISNVDFAFEKK